MFAGEPICPIFDLTILSDATAVQLLLKFLLPSALDSFAPIRYLFTTYSRSSTLISLYFSHLLFRSGLRSHGKMMPFTSFSGQESCSGAACGPQYKQTCVNMNCTNKKKRCTIFASVALQGYAVMCENAQRIFSKCSFKCKFFPLVAIIELMYFIKLKKENMTFGFVVYIVNGLPCSLNISSGP